MAGCVPDGAPSGPRSGGCPAGPGGPGGEALLRAKAELRARMRGMRSALEPGERARLSALACGRLLGLPEVREARVLACYLAIGSELSLAPLFRELAGLPRPPQVALPVTLSGRRLAFVRVDLEALAEDSDDASASGPPAGSRAVSAEPSPASRTAPAAPALPRAFLEPMRPLAEVPPELRERAVAPEEADVVVVPGLAFDEGCRRLGYGGGYYDAFLGGLGERGRQAAPAAPRRPRRPLALGACFDFQLLGPGSVPCGPLDAPLDAVATDERVLRQPHSPAR